MLPYLAVRQLRQHQSDPDVLRDFLTGDVPILPDLVLQHVERRLRRGAKLVVERRSTGQALRAQLGRALDHCDCALKERGGPRAVTALVSRTRSPR